MEKEPTFEINQNQRFRLLVEDLLKKSYLFQKTPPKAMMFSTDEEKKAMEKAMETERVGIIKAIENNILSSFVPRNADDKTLDAVSCLTSIYDELGKDEPDKKFIEQTVEQLKEYL